MRRFPMPRQARGFTLIELAVTISIIALLMMLAVPSFGNATRLSRERTVIQKLAQDMAWARGAAGAANASMLLAAASAGNPTVTLTLNAGCTWTTAINGTTDTAHSMDAATLSSMAPGVSCSSSAGLPLGTTLTFSSQGFVNAAGTITYTGASTQSYQLQILYSGVALRLVGSQS